MKKQREIHAVYVEEEHLGWDLGALGLELEDGASVLGWIVWWEDLPGQS